MSDAERFGPQIDDLHEEDLQKCRALGHVDPILVCPRCGEEIEEPAYD